jgi:hypothetical protein
MEMPRRAPQLHTQVHLIAIGASDVFAFARAFSRCFSRGFTRGFVEVVLIRGLVFLA